MGHGLVTHVVCSIVSINTWIAVRFCWILQANLGDVTGSKYHGIIAKTEKLERKPILLFSQLFVCWWPRTARCSQQVQKYRSKFWLSKNIPSLALAGELWDVYCEYFGRRWPCYIKDVTTYSTCHLTLVEGLARIDAKEALELGSNYSGTRFTSKWDKETPQNWTSIQFS